VFGLISNDNKLIISELKRKKVSHNRRKMKVLIKLKQFNGNISKTSVELNIDQKYLRKWRDSEGFASFTK
jgi:hypothetical protein